MKISVKILVIGGGPAGSTAARILAEHGGDVLLIEKDLAFVKPCGGGLSISAFDELGIPKAMVSKEVKCIRLISPKGKEVGIDLKGSNLAIVRRNEFDQALRNRAEQSGARVMQGEFLHITPGTTHEIEAKVNGTQATILSQYVIAADGINSRVRTSLGIKPSPAFFTASEHIQGKYTDVCTFWFSSSLAPRVYSWMFPAEDGISMGTGCLAPGEINVLMNRFREKTGITADGNRKLYRIPIWKGDLYNTRNVLFAGDAAGQVLPLTYEGIYYAMKAGEFAAQSILEGRVRNYQQRWKDRFQKRFILMGKLRDYFLRDDDAAERLVSLHQRPEIQEASLGLWIRKERSNKGLLKYMRLFGKVLR
jgi:geranylgeranyl reductase